MASGEALLDKMRRTPHGWGEKHLDRLLKYYGFVVGGTKHAIYRHELLNDGRVVTVPRHRKVRAHVVKKAIKAVDYVQERRSRDGQ